MFTTATYVTKYPLNLKTTYICTISGDNLDTFSWTFSTAINIQKLTGHQKFVMNLPNSQQKVTIDIQVV